MQMALKFAVTAEAKPTDNADHRGGIRLKAHGHGAHAEEHVLAGVLKDRTDNFLALDAELIDPLNEVRGSRLGRGLFAFHHARELPNSGRVSTGLMRSRRAKREND